MALVQIAQINDSVKSRFWAKVNKLGPDQCWHWLGTKVGRGYGRFTINYATHSATHVSLAIAKGITLRRGEMACHRCDNPQCVNPAHLFVGTAYDNAQDAKRKGRSATGERNGAAKLTGEQIEIILAERAKTSKRYWGRNELAVRFGVHPMRIQAVVNGKNVTAAAIRARKDQTDG